MFPGEVLAGDKEPSTKNPVGKRWHVTEWMVLLLAPPAAWLAFGIVLINQDSYIDPWYYLGYGRAFTTLHSMFGWRYYVVRFPVMMLNELFLSGNHPLIGYALLRYLLVLACGFPLYVWARKEFGRPAAVLGYLFLFCNPLLPRVILWDLTPFMSVPMALGAFAVWLRSDRMHWRVVSGALMMASVASQVFTGTAILTFLAVQVVRRLRAREVRGLIVNDVIATGLGAAVCFGIGCLYYWVRIGPFDPMLIVQVTANASGIAQEYARTHSTPYSVWAAREYYVYVPPFCVAMAGWLLGRRLLANTAVASVWWFAAAYTAAYFAYQLVFGRFVLETFYYFSHLTLVVFPLIPIIVSEFTRSDPARAGTRVALAGTVGLLVLPAVNRVLPALGPWTDNYAFSNTTLLAAMMIATSLVIVAARPLASKTAGAVMLGLFLVCLQAFVLLSPIHRYVFDSRHRDRERAVYVAAIEMLDVFESFSKPGAHVIPWICPAQLSVGSITSTVLLYSLSDPWSKGPCEARIGKFELAQLQARPRYVLMMNEHPEIFAEQEAALRENNYRVQERLTRTIGDEAYQATIRLVEIELEAP